MASKIKIDSNQQQAKYTAQAIDFANILKMQTIGLLPTKQKNIKNKRQTHSKISSRSNEPPSFIKVQMKELKSKISSLSKSERFSEIKKRLQDDLFIVNENFDQKTTNKKIKKKQTQIKKKKKYGKFQKVGSKSNVNVNQLLHGNQTFDDGFVNIKMLLNSSNQRSKTDSIDFSPRKSILNDSFSAYSKQSNNENININSPYLQKSSVKKNQSKSAQKSWLPPPQSLHEHRKQQQIKTIKHRPQLWPSCKKQDCIEKMQKLKYDLQSKQKQKNAFEEAEIILRSRVKSQEKKSISKQEEEIEMIKMCVKGIGNKYVEKIVQNYIGKNFQIVKKQVQAGQVKL